MTHEFKFDVRNGQLHGFRRPTCNAAWEQFYCEPQEVGEQPLANAFVVIEGIPARSIIASMFRRLGRALGIIR